VQAARHIATLGINALNAERNALVVCPACFAYMPSVAMVGIRRTRRQTAISIKLFAERLYADGLR
jgi:hypothetical protein